MATVWSGPYYAMHTSVEKVLDCTKELMRIRMELGICLVSMFAHWLAQAHFPQVMKHSDITTSPNMSRNKQLYSEWLWQYNIGSVFEWKNTQTSSHAMLTSNETHYTIQLWKFHKVKFNSKNLMELLPLDLQCKFVFLKIVYILEKNHNFRMGSLKKKSND